MTILLRALGRACALASIFAALAARDVRAAEVGDLSSPAIAGKTWIELLRGALPDVAADARLPHVAAATRGVALRALGDVMGDGDWPRAIRVTRVDAYRATIGGAPRLVVALDLDDGASAPLLLFEADGEGRLLDAVNVKSDQLSSLDERGLLPLGERGALLVARSAHSNSNQSYAISSLVLVDAARFSLIGSVLTYGEHTCRRRMTQQLTVSPKAATPMARIDAHVARVTQRLGRDCETPQGKPTRETFSGAYVWDAATGAYRARRPALDRLEKQNEGRF